MKFKGERKIWEDERKCEEFNWKTRKHEIKKCGFKDFLNN